MAIDLARIRAVTFDCYGTLIDWEAGLRAYVAPLLLRAARAGIVVSPEEWVARWEPIQFGLLSPWQPYATVLAESFAATMRALELESFADGGPGLVRSLGEWPPFADTGKALRALARRRRIGIVSNIDRALLAETLGRLQAPLSMTATAEEAGAYKPDPAPFRLALERLGLPADQVLHAAFGWKYDLAPARALGLRTCFVDRGGARPALVEADLEVGSLAELAEVLEAAPPA
jgi:2-haloacid dehalogenase